MAGRWGSNVSISINQAYGAFARWVATPALGLCVIAALAGFWPPRSLCQQFEQAKAQQSKTRDIEHYASDVRTADRAARAGHPSQGFLANDDRLVVDPFAHADEQTTKRQREHVAIGNLHGDGQCCDQDNARKACDELVPTVQFEAAPETTHSSHSPIDGPSVAADTRL